MARDELLAHMRTLYGLGALRFEATDDEIREEAIRQTFKDFENNRSE